jgi:hypothetical protein
MKQVLWLNSEVVSFEVDNLLFLKTRLSFKTTTYIHFSSSTGVLAYKTELSIVWNESNDIM